MKLIQKCLETYIVYTNRVVTATGYLVSWLTTGLVLIVCYDVFSRYLLSKSIVAIQELEWHLFALIFLLGAASALQNDKHVRVDVLYSKFSETQRAWINFLGSLIWLIPFSIVVIWTSSRFAMNAFSIRESSPDPGGLSAWYLLKASIPLGFLLLLLQGVSLCFRSLLTIVGVNEAKPPATN